MSRKVPTLPVIDARRHQPERRVGADGSHQVVQLPLAVRAEQVAVALQVHPQRADQPEDGGRRAHRGVAVQVEFGKENFGKKTLKPGFHIIGSRVETRRFQAMGQLHSSFTQLQSHRVVGAHLVAHEVAPERRAHVHCRDVTVQDEQILKTRKLLYRFQGLKC